MAEGVDLLVASGGGHLKQLTRLARRVQPSRRALWATPRTSQSESLLAGEDVIWLPFVGSRDLAGTWKAGRHIWRGLDDHHVSRVISTGAAPAIAAVPTAWYQRAPFHYIESAARVAGPSLTGSMLRRVPGVRCHTQYYSWAGPGWSYVGSVFDDFTPGPAEERPVRSVVVTLGMHESFQFPRLIGALLRALPPSASVLWQVPPLDRAGFPPGHEVVTQLPEADLAQAMRESDLVICHAGCGSALTALESGHRPVLVPRRAEHGEHVDNHQEQIAHELQRRDVADVVTPEQISRAVFETQLRKRVIEQEGPSIQLGETPS